MYRSSRLESKYSLHIQFALQLLPVCNSHVLKIAYIGLTLNLCSALCLYLLSTAAIPLKDRCLRTTCIKKQNPPGTEGAVAQAAPSFAQRHRAPSESSGGEDLPGTATAAAPAEATRVGAPWVGLARLARLGRRGPPRCRLLLRRHLPLSHLHPL